MLIKITVTSAVLVLLLFTVSCYDNYISNVMKRKKENKNKFSYGFGIVCCNIYICCANNGYSKISQFDEIGTS